MKYTSIPFFLLFCLAQFFPAHDALAQSTPNDRYFSNMHHDPCLPNIGHHDYIQAAGSEGSIVSTSDGFWDDPNTWQGGIIPSSSKTAIIYHSVTIRNTSAEAFDTVVYPNSGHLQFSPSENTQLRTGTLFTYPGSKLTIGTKANPIHDNKVAEIVYVDRKINLTADPAQYSHGLLVVGGDIVIHGATLPKTFYSLTKEVHAGDMVLELQSVPEQWKPGHILLLPGTEQPYYADGIDPNIKRFDRRKIELVEIDSINGKNVHLKAPAQVDHFGAHLRNGDTLHFPHVANLSRNVIFRSANPDGERGHSLFGARANIDINYAAFINLGRTINKKLDKTVFGENCSVEAVGTNQPARYPFHTHHLIGAPNPTNTGYQFSVVGNAVYNTLDSRPLVQQPARSLEKWGMVYHSSSFGLVKDNVVFNVAGFGIGTEHGQETEISFINNFVSGVNGTVGRGKFQFNGSGDTEADIGSGFWLATADHTLIGNVCTTVAKSCYDIYGGANAGPPSFRKALYRGAMIHGHHAKPGIDYEVQSGDTLAFKKFEDNTCYSSLHGFEFWYYGYRTYYDPTKKHIDRAVVKNFIGWNIGKAGIFAEQLGNLDFDGAQFIGDYSIVNNRYNRGEGLNLSRVTNITFNNLRIENYKIGIASVTQLGEFRTANSPPLNSRNDENEPILFSNFRIANTRNALNFGTPSIDRRNSFSFMDIHFIDGVLEGNNNDISGSYSTGRFRNLLRPRRILLQNVLLQSSNKVLGSETEHVEYFTPQQASDAIMPATRYESWNGDPYFRVNALASPAPNITGAEWKDIYETEGFSGIEKKFWEYKNTLFPDAINHPTYGPRFKSELAMYHKYSTSDDSHDPFVLGHRLAPCNTQAPGVNGFVCPASGAARVDILSPRNANTIATNKLLVSYRTWGDLPVGSTVNLKYNDSATVTGLATSFGDYTVNNVEPGAHTIRVWAVTSGGQEIQGASKIVNFNTTLPVSTSQPKAPTGLRVKNPE